MRRLLMWNMATLDGFFEGRTPWDIEFHNYGFGEELEQLSNEQLQTTDMLLFGRKTFVGMADYWQTATGTTAELMNSIPKVVFSRSLESANWSNSRLVKTDAVAEVARLKAESGKDLFVFGSAELAGSLLRAGLFDELRIGVNPVVLGGGNPLFKPLDHEVPLKLLEVKALKTGCVLLRYEPLPAPQTQQ